MPTYMLEGTTPVALSPRPLTVTLQMQGPVAGTIQASADGVPVANAVRPRPELLILPSVEGRIRLHVEPVGASVFAQGSRAHVSVGVNDPGRSIPNVRCSRPSTSRGSHGRTCSRSNGRRTACASARRCARPCT